MPTFVIHQLGKPIELKFVDQDSVTIGRDRSADLVLGNVSVSRRHAVVRARADGGWEIEPLKEDNPVIVSGETIEGATIIEEGTELQVGRFYVVFSCGKTVPEGYKGGGRFQYHTRCKDCGHPQKVSAVAENATCEKCGSAALPPPKPPGVRVRSRQATDGAKGPGQSQSEGAVGASTDKTTALTAGDLMGYHARLHEAARARIVRVGAEDKGRVTLDQNKACTFGKAEQTTIPLEGLFFGQPATIKWDRKGYVLQKTGFFPSVKVNGKSIKSSPVKNGDEIRIGKNAFKFVVE